jgi:hypothetical protein
MVFRTTSGGVMSQDKELIDKIKLDIVTYTDGLIGLDDIADHIIKLVRDSEWVSVEDRLPELETNVLTSTLMNDGIYSEPSLGFIFHKRGMPNQGDLVWTNGQVDCWTSTPSPPTNKGGE